ncbi:hypothetical protein ACT91Q_01455 [Brevibacillus thermoruber]|uniref:hypothetical protein n=1 Tax=Brevibacillus thermoruber TaxID=33942 RepID=UPI004041AB29
MKLFWIHKENNPEDIGFYAATNADELLEIISQERCETLEYVGEHYLYAEISRLQNAKNNKWFKVILEETE